MLSMLISYTRIKHYLIWSHWDVSNGKLFDFSSQPLGSHKVPSNHTHYLIWAHKLRWHWCVMKLSIAWFGPYMPLDVPPLTSFKHRDDIAMSLNQSFFYIGPWELGFLQPLAFLQLPILLGTTNHNLYSNIH